jgi:hypothetical protein
MNCQNSYLRIGNYPSGLFHTSVWYRQTTNERVDSPLGEDNIAAYRNLFNEFLSKDTDRKVRSVSVLS